MTEEACSVANRVKTAIKLGTVLQDKSAFIDTKSDQFLHIHLSVKGLLKNIPERLCSGALLIKSAIRYSFLDPGSHTIILSHAAFKYQQTVLNHLN